MAEIKIGFTDAGFFACINEARFLLKEIIRTDVFQRQKRTAAITALSALAIKKCKNVSNIICYSFQILTEKFIKGRTFE